MPNFLNRNHHLIFLDLGGKAELTRIKAFEKFKASGADADVCEETANVINLDTAEPDVLESIDAELRERGLVLGDPDLPGPTTADGGDDLDDKNVTALRKIAKGLKITGYSKLKKPELIAAIRKARGGTVTTDSAE